MSRELRDQIHKAVGLVGSLKAFETRAGVTRLTKFMNDPARTLEADNERKVRACLSDLFRKRYKPRPPKPPTKWDLELAKIERDEAATRIALDGLTDDPKPSGIRCGSFIYDPRGGLTEADYEAFAPYISDADLLQGLREAVDLAEHLRSSNHA